MRKMFWGLLLMVAYLRVSLGGGTVNLLPDFAGTLLFLSGIRELNGESPSLDTARTMLIASTVVFAIGWVRGLVGLYIPGVDAILYWTMLILKVYIPYRCIVGVRELEQVRETDLHSDSLMKCWKLYCVAMPVSLLSSVLSQVTPALAYVSLLTLLMALGAYIAYLIYFYKAGTAYAQSMPPAMEIAEGNTYDT